MDERTYVPTVRTRSLSSPHGGRGGGGECCFVWRGGWDGIRTQSDIKHGLETLLEEHQLSIFHFNTVRTESFYGQNSTKTLHKTLRSDFYTNVYSSA